MNPTQKIPGFRAGQPLSADALNHVVRALLTMIVGGKGIDVRNVAGKLMISAEGQPIPRSGGGGDDVQIFYVEASKALLEAHTDVVDYAIGRVNAGADKGVMYIRNVDNDGWSAVNRLE